MIASVSYFLPVGLVQSNGDVSIKSTAFSEKSLFWYSLKTLKALS